MTVLKLSEIKPFAIGGRRECYVHPDDPSKCIKVLRTDDKRKIRLKKFRIIPVYMRRKYDNNEHERKTLKTIEKRLGKDMQRHTPLCYGYEPTDLGPGLVLDLVRDADGKISRTLRELFTIGHPPEEFRTSFDEFTSFLIDNVILTRSILDHNVVASRSASNSWRLYMIDGFGDPAWLPIAGWFKPLGRRKMRRRARQAWHRFEEFYKTGGVTEQMRKDSTWDQGILRQR